MLSSKISMDDTYSNKSWQIVGQGLFELKEVNQMERELFAFLGYVVSHSLFEVETAILTSGFYSSSAGTSLSEMKNSPPGLKTSSLLTRPNDHSPPLSHLSPPLNNPTRSSRNAREVETIRALVFLLPPPLLLLPDPLLPIPSLDTDEHLMLLSLSSTVATCRRLRQSHGFTLALQLSIPLLPLQHLPLPLDHLDD